MPQNKFSIHVWLFSNQEHAMSEPAQPSLQHFQKQTQKVSAHTQILTETLRDLLAHPLSCQASKYIKLTRRIIGDSFANLSSLKCYFSELGVLFGYNCLQEIFCLLSFSINSLSRLFLAHIKDTDSVIQTPIRAKEQYSDHQFSSQDENDRYGYSLEDGIFARCLTAAEQSQTSALISELLEYQEKITQNSKMFADIADELSEISSIKTSIQMGDQLITNFSKEGKLKLYYSALKIAGMLLANYKKKMTKQLCDKSIQTEKEKESIEGLHAIIEDWEAKYESLMQEKKNMLEQLKICNQQRYLDRKKVEQIEEMMADHIRELSQMKTKHLHEIKKKDDYGQLLKQRINYLEERNNNSILEISFEDDEDDETVSQRLQVQSNHQSQAKSKASRQKIHPYYQKQFKIQKRHNMDMRKSLQLMLSVLSNNKLTVYDPRNLDQDISAGKVNQAVKGITDELEKQLNHHRQRFSFQLGTSSPMNSMHANRNQFKKSTHHESTVAINSVGVQTDEQMQSKQSSSRRDISVGKRPMTNGKGNTSHLNVSERVDRVGNELMQRAALNKRKKWELNKLSGRHHERRGMGPDAGRATYNPLNNSHDSDAVKQNGINVHFEEILMKSGDNPLKKKTGSRMTIMPSLENFRDSPTDSPIIAVEGLEARSEAMRIIEYLEGKNDSENKYFRRFMKKMLEEVGRRKGYDFVPSLCNVIEKEPKRSPHNRARSSVHLLKK